LETISLPIDIYIDINANIDTSFKSASITLILKVVKSRANAIKKNTFVFRRLEKTTIKNCKKKNVAPILSTFVLKQLKSFFLATKNNNIFNIIETTSIESIEFIDTILEFQSLKKTKSSLKKSNLVVKKRKAYSYLLSTYLIFRNKQI